MKFLVIVFLFFFGFLSYQLLTETSETADKELGRILTETDANELKETFEKVVTREDPKKAASESFTEDRGGQVGVEKHEELFRSFSETIEKDEIEGLNLARSYFFNPQLSSETKNEVYDEILSSDITEENKKYLSREILKGPSEPSPILFEKALRNYTANMSPDERRETLSDLKETHDRQEILQVLERFGVDQGF